jgi:hypothetical protein
MTTLNISKNVELQNSFDWIKKSFFVFRESALQFIVLGIISELICFIPFFGWFMSPIFVAQFIKLADKIEAGDSVKMSQLFYGLFDNMLIVRLGFINFCINSILTILSYYSDGGLNPASATIYFSFSFSFTLVVLLVLQMGMWLSPAICTFNKDIQPLQAMWLSIKASCYNIPTLLLYSLMVVAFTVLAIIPVGLGLLIWVPMLNIVSYFVYKSLFISVPAN